MSSFSSNGDASDFMRLPPDSPGSSVSTTLQEEYDELLKYAVVVPSYTNQTIPKTISEFHNNMPLFQTLANMVDPGQGQSENPNDSNSFRVPVNQKQADDVQQYESRDDDTVTEDGNVAEMESLHSASQQHLDHQTSTPLEHTPTQQRTVTQTGASSNIDMNAASEQQIFLHYHRPQSPAESVASSRMTEDLSVAYTGGVDPDIARMENMLDQWTLDLKRNVLAEFGQSKIRLLEQHKQQMLKERERHATVKTQLQNELESMKELLHRYENSVERKDQVIANLIQGLQKHKEKNLMMKAFCEMKISHNNAKKESFASKLAEKHYHHNLQRKCWDSWHSLIENKWKNRVEKACQSKAQEICMGLTNEYETQISSLNSALDTARNEVEHLRHEREKYEETMKKAFMRGVCALNMEAMSMFHDGDGQHVQDNGLPSQPRYASSGSGAPQADFAFSDIDHMSSHSHTVPQEPVFNSEPPGAPLPRVIHTTQQGLRSSAMGQGVMTQGKSITAGSTKRGKTITAKVTSKVDTGRNRTPSSSVLAPPMSSVIVERHQPIVKQTVGHATASQYPVHSGPSGSVKTVVVQKKAHSASTDNRPLPPPNIHKVKVVE